MCRVILVDCMLESQLPSFGLTLVDLLWSYGLMSSLFPLHLKSAKSPGLLEASGNSDAVFENQEAQLALASKHCHPLAFSPNCPCFEFDSRTHAQLPPSAISTTMLQLVADSLAEE